MLKKVKTAFALLTVTLVLCSCTNTNSNDTAQTGYKAFEKDGIMYIGDALGNSYEYNNGIYTDDNTGEEYIYVDSLNTFGGKLPSIRSEYNLTADVHDESKRIEEIEKLDKKNKTHKGYKIPLSLLPYDSNHQYYFEEDWVGRKEYYPENGIYSNYDYPDNADYPYFIFAKDGTRIGFFKQAN